MKPETWFRELRNARIKGADNLNAQLDHCASVLAFSVLDPKTGAGVCTPADLARLMGCSLSTTYRRVAALEGLGWLSRGSRRNSGSMILKASRPAMIRTGEKHDSSVTRTGANHGAGPYSALELQALTGLKPKFKSKPTTSLTGGSPGGARGGGRMRSRGRLEPDDTPTTADPGAQGSGSGGRLAKPSRGPRPRSEKPLDRWSHYDLLQEFSDRARGHIPFGRTDQIAQAPFLATMKRWRTHGVGVQVIVTMMDMFFEDQRNLLDIGDRYPLWQRFVRYGQTHQKAAAEHSGTEESAIDQAVRIARETENYTPGGKAKW